jgi:hypothetical protein
MTAMQVDEDRKLNREGPPQSGQGEFYTDIARAGLTATMQVLDQFDEPYPIGSG